MHKKLRKQQVLKRKNFLPTLLITVLLWSLGGGLIYFVDPDTFLAIPLFFVIIFLAILFTSSLVFANSRRGFITSISLCFYVVLMYLGVGNILNLILLVAIAVTIELYFGSR